MDLRPIHLIVLGAIAVIIGLAILFMPQLLPLLAALALIVLGAIALVMGLSQQRRVS